MADFDAAIKEQMAKEEELKRTIEKETAALKAIEEELKKWEEKNAALEQDQKETRLFLENFAHLEGDYDDEIMSNTQILRFAKLGTNIVPFNTPLPKNYFTICKFAHISHQHNIMPSSPFPQDPLDFIPFIKNLATSLTAQQKKELGVFSEGVAAQPLQPPTNSFVHDLGLHMSAENICRGQPHVCMHCCLNSIL